MSVCYNSSSASIINVRKGKTYRLRILNAAALGYYNIAIAGHNMTVIQQDTCPTKPALMKSIDIAAGQRFDVLITTNQPYSLNYKIQVFSNWRGTDVSPSGGYFAWLRYDRVLDISPLQPPNESKDWNAQYPFIRARDSTVGGIPNATKEIILSISQQRVNASTYAVFNNDGLNQNHYGPMKWPINGVAMKTQGTPYLLASYYGLLDTLYTMNATRPVKLKRGDVIQLVIQNRVAASGVCEAHPWHLHGLKFWVVGMGTGTYVSNHPMNSYLFNLQDPVKVDTAVGYPTEYNERRNYTITRGKSLSPCGWLAIRFVADNLGFWLFHCHIVWHQVLGMSILFDISSDDLWNTEKLDLPYDYTLCGDISKDTINLRLQAQEESSSRSHSYSFSPWMIVSISFIIGFVVLLIPLVLYIIRMRRKRMEDQGPMLPSEDRSTRGYFAELYGIVITSSGKMSS